MHYRLNKYVTDAVVNYLRRVFRNNKEWVNTDFEIVSIENTDTNGQLVFEKFFEENESYPVITVGPQGGSFSKAAFNDKMVVATTDSDDLGVRALSYARVSDTETLAVALPVSSSKALRAITANVAWSGERVGGDDISVKVYQNYLTSPTLVASGSFAGITDESYTELYAGLCPQLVVPDGTWVVFQTGSGSVYNFALDTTVDTAYSTNAGLTQSSGSIDGTAVYPAFVRMGGMYDGSLVLRCQAKNDTAKAYNLSELSSQYLMLAKHALLSRQTSAVNGTILGYLNDSVIPEFVEREIYIKDIRLGVLEDRRRGENDLIFTVSVTMEFNTEWYEDYTADTITAIEPTVSVFS